ncbi:GNAT family N-acetyltransferase [Tsuneonella amylolytica]|uniref:GNAT family N-acetyltransferase n=1 Tax=Tsuneonella amylolytica TaxID=2338327 RepID=UPI000EAAC791|nr:GNAT family protein [Tsuneonella amylolytica]
MELTPTAAWQDDEVELFLLGPDDATEEYVGWLNDPPIAQYLESRFARHDIEGTRQFVADQRAHPGVLFLGIRSTPLGRHVGNIKLGPISRQHETGDIGIMIGASEAWGRGIATRAIRLICAIARDELGLRKVTAGCYASNVGSERAFERAGFAIEGRRPAQFLLDGKPEDMILMGRVFTSETTKDD